MPSRNIIKEYGAHEYYHVYSRGVAKQTIFLDASDYEFFLSLLRRYLSLKPAASKRHGPYPYYGNRVQLLAFCLMPNHIHLLLYQQDTRAMAELLKALMTSYSMYFNRKYDRVGPVFQSRYKASRITSTSYLEHISRYIHLNPQTWESYPYSSLPYYLGQKSDEWLQAGLVMNIFESGKSQYLTFLKDYESQMQMYDEIKWDLADFT